MKKLFFLFFCLFLCKAALCRHYDSRFRNWSYYERGDLIVTAGYQSFRLQAGNYQAYSINCEYMINNTDRELLTVGIRGDMAFGKDYISFAPVGLVVNACLPLFLNSASETWEYGLYALGCLSSLQFHLPICKVLDASAGWSSFKITRLKNLDDKYFINGGVGLGLSLFIRNVIINPYYEYNYNYYWLSNKFNDWFGTEIRYPRWFNGHTFGVRVGFRFNNAW